MPPTSTPLPTSTDPPPTETTEPTATATPLPPLTGSGGGIITFDSVISAGYNLEVYIMNADGTAVQRLTQHPADDSEPAWSHADTSDGLQIAFVSERDGNKELYLLDLEEAWQSAGSSGLRRLTDNDADDYSPTWSPDGTRIGFVSERQGNPEIYVLDVEKALRDPGGAVARRLTKSRARDRDPDWSPAGAPGREKIAFASDRDGNWEIYTISPDGGEDSARRLTHRSENDTDPAWSPDGARIAFSSSHDNSRRIFLMDAAGDEQGSAEPERLTNNREQAFDPVWSPNGALILYSVHNIDKDAGLYVMNADGGQPRYIPEARGGYYQDWRTYPDETASAGPERVVDAPRADAPILDGSLDPDEWSGAYTVELDGGRTLLLMTDGAYLYLGIGSQDAGLGSLCIDQGSQVAVLHASAALGTALYEQDGDGWQPVQGFSWQCRSTSNSSYAQREREEFLAENGWLGTNVNLGTPGELEYQIEMDGERVRLAVSYLGETDGDMVIRWPADLNDDCGLLELVQGYTPSGLQFSPETWVTIHAAP